MTVLGQPITEILDAENLAGRLIDYGILLPRAQSLYEFAATDLNEPRLRDFIENGNPTYAWHYDDRDAWEPRRSRRLTCLVAQIWTAR